MEIKETIQAIKILHSLQLNLSETSELYSAVEFAKKKLFKNLPIQPIAGSELGVPLARCPNCDGLVYDGEWSDKLKDKYFNTVCLHCGQFFTGTGRYKGDWEKTDKVISEFVSYILNSVSSITPFKKPSPRPNPRKIKQAQKHRH